MNIRILSLALTLSLILTGCSGGTQALKAAQSPPSVTPLADPDLDLAAADFGLELLRQTRLAGENTLLSPLSVLLCLSMAANGASGETLTQFEALLTGTGGRDALNANCAALLADYAALNGGTQLSIADSLWLDARAQAEDVFVGRCTDPYQAGIFAADFTAPSTLSQVNAWVEQHTGGHIKQALSQLDPDTVLALVNAVYFEGKWEKEFDPSDTRSAQPFYREDGTQGQVDLMSNGGRTERVLHADGVRGVLLPYQDGRLALMALLPEEGISLADCLERLDGADLQTLITGAAERHLVLLLPKFTAYWQGTLVRPLQAMGLTRAFDPSLADFSAMGTDQGGRPLYLSTVVHGAGIELDEQGTRAFSFTFGGINTTSAPAPDDILTFDRPFVYAIVDLERCIPLFLGTFETSEP